MTLVEGAAMQMTERFPPLPLDAWEDSKTTLHLFLQIVGKVRMALHPKLNHWWHLTLYPSPRGLTTGRIPLADRDIAIDLDLRDHFVALSDSEGRVERFDLPGLTVGGFHRRFFQALAALGVEVAIKAVPYDHKSKIPFAEDETHDAYDPIFVERFSRVLNGVAGVFEQFRGRFLGKSTPVHLYWHSFDLALTRFSGKAAPPMDGGTRADKEAYSHEVISVGFWAGDDTVREPAFYAYAYPEPAGIADISLSPGTARWVEQRGSHLAFLPYEAVRTDADPTAALLGFLESAYQGAAALADWPVEDLTHRA